MRYTKKEKENLLKFFENDFLTKKGFIQFLYSLRALHNESLFVNPETENLKQASTWVKCLRSGSFVQGTHALFINSSSTVTSNYCCLGVLAATLNTEEFTNRFKKHSGRLAKPYFLYSGVGDLSPNIYNSIQQLVKLLPECNKGCLKRLTLPYLNDYQGFTFDEIADQIEADLKLIQAKRAKDKCKQQNETF